MFKKISTWLQILTGSMTYEEDVPFQTGDLYKDPITGSTRYKTEKQKALCFSVNEGKGAAKQVIPVQYLDKVIEKFEYFVTNGIPEYEAEERFKPPHEVLEESIKVEEIDGVKYASFRFRRGKGGKPAKVPLEDLPKFIEYLKTAEQQIREVALSEPSEE
jgi:hypothetical protein